MRLLLVCLAALGGCYSPTIGDEDLRCGPDRSCPSGFGCSPLTRRCVTDNGTRDFSLGPYRGGGELGDITLVGATGELTLDTMTGAITLGATVIVPERAPGFQLIEQTDAPRLALWAFNSLKIPPGMKVQPALNGFAVPVLAAVDTMVMNGNIRCAGFGGPGGGPGGAGKARDTSVTSGGGGPGGGTGGGGGGGYGTAGKTGGAGGGTGGGAGATFGNPEILPVQVGAGGGGGGGAMGGIGGSGGGGIVLFAKRLDLGGTIDCSGEDGRPAMGGAGGGGSGGSIMISAETLQYGMTNALRAIGGKGASSGGTGGSGGDGGDGRIWIGAFNAPMGLVNATPIPQILMGERGVITDFIR
jgi:hypothetical protein